MLCQWDKKCHRFCSFFKSIYYCYGKDFLLKYFEAIALKSIEVFDFKSCHHKIFFPRTSISTNVKIFWKNHFIMSKSLYIWIKNPCNDNMLLCYENETNHDNYKFIRKLSLSLKLFIKLIKNTCILLEISSFCFLIILFLYHNWNASLARKYFLRNLLLTFLKHDVSL